MMNNNVKTSTNCCGVTGNDNDNGYDFVMGVLLNLGICLDDYVVHIRQKYREEDDWDDDNELLLANTRGYRESYEWTDDWWEGQPYVEVLGATRIYDLVIPDFETK